MTRQERKLEPSTAIAEIWGSLDPGCGWKGREVRGLGGAGGKCGGGVAGGGVVGATQENVRI